MHIVSTTSQIVKFIARDISASYTVVIVDEESNDTITKTIAANEVGNYQVSDLDFAAVEDRYYTLELLVDGVLSYRGKIYCTNQTVLPKFTTQRNEYTEATSSDNEYIIYE